MDWSAIIVGAMAATATIVAAVVLSKQNTKQHAAGSTAVLVKLGALEKKILSVDQKVEKLNMDNEVLFGMLASQDERLNDAGVPQHEEGTFVANSRSRPLGAVRTRKIS